MRRKPGDVLPPDVQPCEAYAMSDRFRDWAVGLMQKELSGQIGAAGLDRMAILKRPAPALGQPADDEEQRDGAA